MHNQRNYFFVVLLGALAGSVIGTGTRDTVLSSTTPFIKKAQTNGNVSLSYGAPVFTTTTSQIYTLPNFTVSGSDEIANVSITVGSGSVTATANSAYKIYEDYVASGAAHKTAILAFSSLQTSAAISDYIRNDITFDSSANSSSDVNAQDIRVSFGIGAEALVTNIPSGDAVSTLIDSDNNTHFYIYDAKPSGTGLSSWDVGYDYAKSLKLFGMTGYLATITSETEDKVMDNLTSEGGWAGAICDTVTTLDASTAAGLGQSGTAAARKVKTNWKWVCGPEAGTGLFKSDGTVSGYDGWKGTSEPNGVNSGGSEWALYLHFGGHWNDYPATTMAGVFVEFSLYPTSTAISFDQSLSTGNWNVWVQTVAANFATNGTATRSAKNGTKTETWNTIPYLPQPDGDLLGTKIGDLWTEAAYTAPTTSATGSVIYTASGSRSSQDDEMPTAYSLSITKTLMKLAQAAPDSTTLLTGLDAGQTYQVTLTNGDVIAITADSSGQFNFGTYTDPTYGSLLGMTFQSMVMVDGSGTTISETQTLPSTVIRRQYDVPVATITYGDNDTVVLSGLVAGHTYTINNQTLVADATSSSITISGVISDTAAVSLDIKDVSVDETKYISSYNGTVSLVARDAAPDVSGYSVTAATNDNEKASVAVPALSEYFDTTTNAWVKGAASASVTPGQSLKVRVSATGSKPASNITEVPTPVYQQATPSATINYLDGRFENLEKNATYIIDNKEYTSDENGYLEIDIPLYGHTFDVVLKHTHTDGSDEDSEGQSLNAMAMPAAPAASNYPVTETTSADGKAIISVPAGSDYEDPLTKKWVKGPAEVSVTPGSSIQVRTSSSASSPFSHFTTISTSPYTQPTPSAAIDYPAGKFTGLTPNAIYLINGVEYTADADGKIAIDASLYGQAITLVKKHVNSDGSDVDSAAQSLTVAAVPAAPDPSTCAVSETTSADGKATISVPAGSEYKDPTTGEWVKGPANVSVTPGTSLEVRIAATSTSPASPSVMIKTDPFKEPTPAAVADYHAEKLTGFVANAVYTINGSTITAGSDGTLAIPESWFGTTLSIIRVHVNSDGSDIDSDAESVSLAARPEAPSAEEIHKKVNFDGTVSVTIAATYEYSLDGGSTWTMGDGKEMTLDAGATLQVRVPVSDANPVGKVADFTAEAALLYTSPLAIILYCLLVLLLFVFVYRILIFCRWHSKDKHNHLGFFVANNRWANKLFFGTPYNKVELAAMEQAETAKKEEEK